MSDKAHALDVGEEDWAALEADLGRLNSAAPGLGDRAVRFVAAGGDAGVLDEIKIHGRGQLGTSLRSYDRDYDHHVSLRRRALMHLDPWCPAVVYRFALVLDGLREASGQKGQKADTRVASWLRTLFVAVTEVHRLSRYITLEDPLLKRFFVIQRLEELLAAADEPNATLLYQFYGAYDPATGFSSEAMEGLAEFLAANVSVIAAILPNLPAEGRERLMIDLDRLGLEIAPYFDVVFTCAVGSSKAVRRSARSLLQDAAPEALMERAARTLATGATAERREAVDLLAMLVGEPAADMLASHAEVEKSQGVRDAIAAAIARTDAARAAAGTNAGDGDCGLRAVDGSPLQIPPMPEIPADTPFPAELLQPIAAQIAHFNRALALHNAKQEEFSPNRNWSYPHPLLEEDQAIPRFLAVLNGETDEDAGAFDEMMSGRFGFGFQWDRKPFLELFARPEVTPWHLLRLFRRYLKHRGSVFILLTMENPFPPASALRARLEGGLDFRVAMRILDAVGEPADMAARQSLQPSWGYDYPNLECATTHLYFLEHLDLIEEAFGLRPQSGKPLEDKAALRLLAWLPQVPERFAAPLVELAIGPRKQMRAPARAILANARDLDDRIIARLADANRDIRNRAAEWIAERGLTRAVPQLKTLLKGEKSEGGRALLVTALARLGEDISEHFSENALQAEAEKGLAKAPPKSLEWFPFPALPDLRWQSGARVPPVVVKWWVVLADKLKEPAGNALFELYLDRLVPEDAARLGLFLLQTFIERDTTTCSEAEATLVATQTANQAQANWQHWSKQQHPGYASAFSFDYDEIFAAAKASKLREHAFSCPENRGLLGLASRAPGAQAGGLVRRYLKLHGNKVTQSKALLAALARNRSPAAIQVVLAAASRLKQKSIQALAQELVADIADQHGWTPDELADRIIPSAGFGDEREMELNCGEGRVFRAVYRGEGRIDLLNPNGKPVRALPDPRRDEEKGAVAAAKKQIAAARTEIKQIEDLQRQRLYEAMCVERRWTPETWTNCLQNHPVMGLLCQRLIWLALDEGGAALRSFRPLEDGSLSSRNDGTVDLAGAAFVKLAHQALLSASDADGWLRHCSDYEVAPLFAQFGKTVLCLDAISQNASAIEDRQGWTIDNLKLHSTADKLGYDRGEVSEGAGFSDYVKRFQGVGIQAVIAFTGSYVGAKEAFPCALKGLSFQRIAANRRPKPMPLPEVPPVLLSEAWGDFHAVAAAGSGYDAGWQEKGLF